MQRRNAGFIFVPNKSEWNRFNKTAPPYTARRFVAETPGHFQPQIFLYVHFV